VRQRAQTIGGLGRAPARQAAPPEPPTPSDTPPPPERGLLRRWLHGALFDNTGLKFLSLVLAVTVFLLINTDKDREITVRIPVKYDVPADMVLTSKPVEEVRVTLRGPWRRLRSFDEREINRIILDLRNTPSGDVAITPDMITNLPAGLEIIRESISPRSVRVAFDKRVEKLVEVTPIVTGQPQHGYEVKEVKAAPPTAQVRGGERLLAALSSVRTTEVSVEGRNDSFDQLAALAPPEGVTVDPTQRIGVHVVIDEKLTTQKVLGLGVTPRGDGIDPTKWTLTPAQVEVTLTGSLLAVEKAKATMAPIVKLVASDQKPREVEVTMEGMPPGVGVKISPERVKVVPNRSPAPIPPP
jgi:YbbR domain-containing protein